MAIRACMQTATILQSRFVVRESQGTLQVVCAVLNKAANTKDQITLYNQSLTDKSSPILRNPWKWISRRGDS